MSGGLELRGLAAAYDGGRVLDAVSLRLPKGCIGALLGPSGSGKTTLLRLLAGFEKPVAGSILLDDVPLASPQAQTSPEARGFAMVFQDLALLPHLNALDNVTFALHRLPRPTQHKRAIEALEMMGVAPHRNRRPHELSGGQQQRVAVARALAFRPRLLLMDEPFSSLDEELRGQLRSSVHTHVKQLGITTVLVTHSQQEAYALGDWVGVLHAGRLLQWDTPYNLYHRPASRTVADFMGEGVFLRGRRQKPGGPIQTELGPLMPSATDRHGEGPGAFDVLLRPDDVLHDDDSPWQARIIRKEFRGAEFLYEVALDSGTRLLSVVPSHHNHRVGECIGIRLCMEHVISFPADPPL